MASARIDGSDEENAQVCLARNLVDCMGRESAIHVCKVNGWIGVLEVLTEQQRSSAGEDS